MSEFLQQPGPRLVMLSAISAILILVGYYVIIRFRPGRDDGEPGSSDLMTNFRELYDRGEISEEEYRTIKTKLATRLHKDLKANKKEG